MSRVYLFFGSFLLGVLSLYYFFTLFSEKLQIIACNVGQGDAYLIQQGFYQILIDGGPANDAAVVCLGRYMPFFDKHIDFVIATHADFDHIGGLLSVFSYYHIDHLALPRITTVSDHYLEFLKMAKNYNSKLYAYGDMFSLNSDVSIKFLWPNAILPANSSAKDTNIYAYVVEIQAPGYRFLFTADAEHQVLEQLLDEGVLSSKYTLISAPHHGSEGGLSSRLLDYSSPDEVVISVGKDNVYGLPDPTTLGILSTHKIPYTRTDVSGDIFRSY